MCFACSEDWLLTSKLNLFKAIDSEVKVQVDMNSVRDEDAVVNSVEAFRIKFLELAEE